ncbi:MAG: YfdQ family protein [Burkholderiaceae bacterium]|nr:YfdQ family protein [Burkholderiaceae bacterium]
MNEHLHADGSTVKAITDLVAAGDVIKEIDNTRHLVIPEGYQHIEVTKAVEAAAPTPMRKKGTVQLAAVDSFTKYLTDHGLADNCYIYADPDSRTLTGVLNDHMTGDDTAGWRDHRAVYTAEYTREFALWMKHDGQQMEQEQFAMFLEDNIADVVEPSGETLMQVALTLQAKTEVAFKSHRRLDNGQVQFGYSENMTSNAGADGQLEIPREFKLGLRVFKNAPDAYKIKARLKYRLTSQKLKFWYELDRPVNVVEDAFKAYVSAAQESGFTVLMGKP